MEELPFHSDDNSDDSGNELVKETSTKIVKLKIDYTPLSLDQEVSSQVVSLIFKSDSNKQYLGLLLH